MAGPPGSTPTVVIVLPGGRARDRSPARPTRLANLRMIPIATAALGAASGSRVAGWRLRYRYRGWNEPYLDPVQDVRWALNEARTRYPGARVVLVGHSMGGRAALYAAGDRSVVAVCAASVRLVTVTGDGHAMVLRWRDWHELVRDFIAGVVGAASHDRHP